MIDLNKKFPNKYFAKSEIQEILFKGDKDLVVIPRSSKTIEIYKNFNEQFKISLDKLPSNSMKKLVIDIYNRDKLYILISSGKPETGIISRTIIDSSNNCIGVGLLSNELNIDIRTGESNTPIECVYGAYQGLIRTAAIVHKDKILKDIDLNKLLATYFYLIILKALGKMNIYNNKQKNFIYIVCLYAYYKHFLNESSRNIQLIIQKHFKDEKLLEYYDEFKPQFKILDRYNSIKDLAKMLIDTNTLIENPNVINMTFIKTLRISGYYSIVGSLDLLLSMCLLSKYPTNIYNKNLLVNKLQDIIELLFIKKYIENIKFSSYIIKEGG